jgi:hypothetical protein
MLEPDFAGLADHVQAAFKPQFTDVVRRAGRRRLRGRVAGAAVVTMAGVGAAGLTVNLLPASEGSILAGPSAPAASSEAINMANGYGPTIAVGDLTHLYLTYTTDRACQPADCVFMLAASTDRGVTWQPSRRLPVPASAVFPVLTPLSATTLLMSSAAPASDAEDYLASTDAGRTWHTVTVTQVGSIPTGWRLLPTAQTAFPTAATLLAADPTTGNVVRLAPDPAISAGAPVDVPTSAGLWLSGNELLPVPTGSVVPEAVTQPNGSRVDILRGPGTVAVSHDGGRTWQRSRFPDMNNGYDGGNPPIVATYDGRTAYVLVPKGDTVVVYRSADSGATWAPTGGTLPATRSQVAVSAAAVRRDGTLLIELTNNGATKAAYASTDVGRTFHALSEDHVTAVPVLGGYAQIDLPSVTIGPGGNTQTKPGRGCWLSTDGLSGTWITPPNLN